MSLLRTRGFFYLFSAQFLLTFAAWALRTVLLIWVYGLTHSGVAVSVVGLAEAVPLLVLAPVAGVFVDRWNRSATMAGASLIGALALLPLFAVSGRSGLPIIVAVAIVANSAAQVFFTASGAALPVVAGTDNAGQANGLMSLLNGAIAITAPGPAALLYAAGGPRATILVLLGIYLLAVPVAWLIPAPRAAGTDNASPGVVGEMLDGLRYARKSPLLVGLVVMASVAGLGLGALSVLDVVFVTRALHLRSESVGLLLSSSGFGELTGGIIMSIIAGAVARRYHLLLGLCTVVCGVALLGYAVAPTLLVAAAMLTIVGLSFPPLIVSFTTMMQWVTEDAFMGRVNSVVSTSMAVMMILSLVAGGALTDLFGVRQVIAGSATLLCVSGGLALLLIRSTPSPPPRLEESLGPLAVLAQAESQPASVLQP